MQEAGPSGRWALAYGLIFGNYLSIALGQFHLATQAAQNSFDIYTELEDQWGIGVSAWFLGLVHERKGYCNQSINSLQISINTLNSIGERCYIGHALNTLSRIEVARGQYEDAESHLQQSTTYLRHLYKVKDQAFTAPSAGLLALESGNLHRAEQLFKESIKVAEEHDERGNVFYCRNGLGYVARLRGQFEESEANHTLCLQASRMVGWQWGVALSLFHLGCLELDRGEYQQARNFCSDSLELAETLSVLPLMARCWIRLAYVHCAVGELAEAIPYLEKAMDYGSEESLPPVTLAALAGVAMTITYPMFETPSSISEPEIHRAAQAVELLVLTKTHPENAYETKLLSGRLLEKMTAVLPPDLLKPTLVKGEAADLADTSQRWREKLRRMTKS